MKHQKIILESVQLAQKEILNDVLRGVVPTDVADFGELHDYVDANMYGNTESIDQLQNLEEEIQILNQVQDALSKWISTGQMQKELNQLQIK